MSNIKIVKVSPHLEVHENIQNGFKSLISTQLFEPGIVLSTFNAGTVLSAPGMHSIQIDDGQHIVPNPYYLQYMNHSCVPNIFIDLKKREIKTIRTIKRGEEIVFFYPSTEWKMAEPFECSCGDDNCLSQISGAYRLTSEHFFEIPIFGLCATKVRPRTITKRR